MQTLQCLFFRVLVPVMVAVVVAGCSPGAKKSRFLQQAERYFSAGEYDKAKIEYLNVLRADPQNATAIQRLGTIWSEEGAPLRALPFLMRARQLSPNNLIVRTKLAAAFMSLGNLAEARKEAIAILDQSPTNDETILILADAARTQQEMSEVEQRLHKLDERNSASFHLASAGLYVRKGDLSSAESALQRAVALDPKLPAAHLAMASLHLLRGDRALAAQEFKTATDLAPFRSVARLGYADFKTKTGSMDEAAAILKETTRKAPDYLPAWGRLAQLAFSQKKYDESLALLENVFSRDGTNFEAGALQAEVRLAKGEVKQALEGLESLNKTYPNAPLAKYELARAYLRNNNPAQAAVVLNQAVTLNPDFAEAILLLGEVNLRAGDAQAVVDSMKSLLKKRPNLTQAETLLATGYRSLGRLDDAAEIFQEQISSSPRRAEPQIGLGLILRQQQKLSDARKAFEKALELEPENVPAVEQLVELDILDKDFDSAFQRVQRQLQKTPAVARFLEGKIYAAQKQWDRAETALLSALQLDPNFSSASDLLVSTYLASNKPNQALGQLKEMLSKSPEDTRLLMLSGQIYEKMDQFSDARDAYEKVLSRNPDFAPALNNVARLYAERLNQLDKAYELARKAWTLKPEDAIIADTLGWIHYKRGEYQEALTLLEESVGKRPNSPEMQFHLGMAHYMMGHTEAARTALSQAAKTQWDFPGKEMIAPRLALLGDGADKLTELSTDELEKILQQQPDDIFARIRLGEFYERQGAIAKASAAYEQALEVNPGLLSATLKLAQLNAGPLANTAKAVEFARKARKLAPDDPQTARILGSLAYKSGDFTEAYSLLNESARQESNDAGILHDLAWAAYSLGKVSEAQQTMQRLLQAGPDGRQSEEAKTFLAMTALDQNGSAAAEVGVDQLLRANHDYVPALMARAAIQVQRGESKAAAGTYTEVLRRFPDFTPAQEHLAALYAEDPDHVADAYDLAMKARRALPDDPELAQILGEISYKRNQFAYAVELFEESARKRPLSATYLYYLGMCHWQLKEKSQSQDILQRALEAGLQEPLLTDAKGALAELHRE